MSNASFSFIQEGTEMSINYESYMFLAMKGTVDSMKLHVAFIFHLSPVYM